MDRLRIVIIENERIVARDLANHITGLGCSVLGIGGTPDAGLELTERTRPDMVLMDIRLGTERDGISLAQEIRDRLEIPSIFVTAYTDDETLRRAERVGPLGYIVKPFRYHELKATLVMAAKQRRLTLATEESRAWLSAVLASLGDGVIAIDASDQITLVNPATETILQLSAAGMLGRKIEDVLDIGNIHESGRGTATSRVNVMVLSRRGGDRIIEVSSAPVRLKHETSAGTVLVLRDVTERTIASNLIQRQRDFLAGRVSTAGAELERNKEELHVLAAGILTAQEDERRRIAREIHDDLAQRAAALEIGATGIERALGENGGPVQRRVKELRDAIRELSDSMRALSHNLHPSILEDLGLEIALRQYAEEYSHRENISLIFRATRVPRVLPPAYSFGIYRIAQEALRNVARHSGSPVASVSLAHIGNYLRLIVRDRGKGFDPAGVRYGEGLGLISMQERSRALSGRLSIISRTGAGTLLCLRVPLDEAWAPGAGVNRSESA